MFYDGAFYMGGMHGLWWIFWIVLIGALLLSMRSRNGQRRRESPQEELGRRRPTGHMDSDDA